MENIKINPRLLIQHYLRYPYQTLGNVVDDPAFNPGENYKFSEDDELKYSKYYDSNNSAALSTFNSNNPMVWNTNARTESTSDMTQAQWYDYLNGLRPKNSPVKSFDFSTPPTQAEKDKYQIEYKNAREADPKFSMKLNPNGGNTELTDAALIASQQEENQVPLNQADAGEIVTQNVLYRLFADDAIRYFEEPGIRYMDKLFNTWNDENDQEADLNENYTLNQIWLAISSVEDSTDGGFEFNDPIKDAFWEDTTYPDKNLSNNNSIDQYIKIDVPLHQGSKTRHDPSKILFTNDPNNLMLNGEEKGWTEQSKPGDQIRYAFGNPLSEEEDSNKEYDPDNPDYQIMIYVTDGLIIRLVFDPTEQDNFIIEDVDFFDYDISTGVIYTSANAAKNAYGIYKGTMPSPLAPVLLEVVRDENGNLQLDDNGIPKIQTKEGAEVSYSNAFATTANYYFETSAQEVFST
ncbi:MAG: hypothetical protein K2H85_06905, partial [Allobaculum sp.]|nr:hypothetical protein [Allobaculum sp.]